MYADKLDVSQPEQIDPRALLASGMKFIRSVRSQRVKIGACLSGQENVDRAGINAGSVILTRHASGFDQSIAQGLPLLVQHAVSVLMGIDRLLNAGRIEHDVHGALRRTLVARGAWQQQGNAAQLALE